MTASDRRTYLVVVMMALVALIGLVGIVALAATERPIPDALTLALGVAVGALGNQLTEKPHK